MNIIPELILNIIQTFIKITQDIPPASKISSNNSKIFLLSVDRNIFYFADRWNRCLLLGFRNRCRHNSVASTRRTLPCTSKKLIQIQTIYEIEYLFATFIGINFGTLMFHNVSTVNCVSSFLKDSWNSEVFTQFNS